mmetsp:Transcript_12899/g.41192  ORF Transcript_12899/g.41192 Transcript_12899/m.41192 type:complete len:241 (+) Transcript_12899:31-753(+)
MQPQLRLKVRFIWVTEAGVGAGLRMIPLNGLPALDRARIPVPSQGEVGCRRKVRIVWPSNAQKLVRRRPGCRVNAVVHGVIVVGLEVGVGGEKPALVEGVEEPVLVDEVPFAQDESFDPVVVAALRTRVSVRANSLAFPPVRSSGHTCWNGHTPQRIHEEDGQARAGRVVTFHGLERTIAVDFIRRGCHKLDWRVDDPPRRTVQHERSALVVQTMFDELGHVRQELRAPVVPRLGQRGVR